MAGIRYITPPRQFEDRLIEGKDGSSFYIKVRGGLTTEELQTVSLILEAEDEDAFDIAAELSEEIHLAEGISRQEAYSIIERATFRKPILDQDEETKNKELEIKLKYNEDIRRVRVAWKSASLRETEAAITAMIRCRVETDGEWTIKDTREKLTGDVFSQIADLMNEEQRPYQKPSQPPSEEELKKPQEAEEQNPKSIGSQSSTNSQKPTPANTAGKPLPTKSAQK